MHGKVTIITPLYNCSDFLDDTLNSVLAQTYQNWEVIMVDDCSSDNSVLIAQEFVEKNHRIKLIQLEKNTGAAVARSKPIEAASGRFIGLLKKGKGKLSEKF